MRRSLSILCTVALVASLASAKSKKKPTLPDYILKARTVFVVIAPDAGEPVTDPMANRTAQDNVEKAIMKWGRFELVPDVQTADLVIAVRKGHPPGATIQNSPADNRPVVIQSTEGNTRVGAQQGRPPGLSGPEWDPAGQGPRITNEIGPTEDMFEVYMAGGIEYPLDGAPVWRCMGKDSLKAPRVEAVEQFRKAIDDSEQQRQRKP